MTQGIGLVNGVPLESNGAIPVNIQDQHTRALDLGFIRQERFTTLAVETAVNDVSLEVVDATGFINDKVIGIFTPTGEFYFGTQTGAAVGNVISVGAPIDTVFPVGSAVLCAERHMNVDGSIEAQVFQIGPVGGASGVEIDITRILGFISDGSAMDDGRFGSRAALENGITLRLHNGVTRNIWSARTNGDIGLLCFDVAYTDKAPAGEYGFRFRNSYGGQPKHGVTLRLEPGDTLELWIRDDLSSQSDMQMMAQGHVTGD